MSLQPINAPTSRSVPLDSGRPGGASRKADILVIVGLLLLSLVPVIAGLVRVVELSTGSEITPENARFFAQPIPVLIHIATVTIYALLGAFQFSVGIRRRAIRWHRRAGRLLVVCGLLAAGSGVWMSLFYTLPEMDGALLLFFRLIFGTGMILSLVLGVRAVLRRDIRRHRAWMIRAYAIALGAGTQVFTHVPWMLLAGIPGETSRAWLMGAGWIINLAVAELIIHRRIMGSPGVSRTGSAVGEMSKA